MFHTLSAYFWLPLWIHALAAGSFIPWIDLQRLDISWKTNLLCFSLSLVLLPKPGYLLEFKLPFYSQLISSVCNPELCSPWEPQCDFFLPCLCHGTYRFKPDLHRRWKNLWRFPVLLKICLGFVSLQIASNLLRWLPYAIILNELSHMSTNLWSLKAEGHLFPSPPAPQVRGKLYGLYL